MIRVQQYTHTSAADEDTEDLRDLVANVKKEKRDDHHADDGPEIEQLGTQNRGEAVGQDGEIITLDVHER